MGRVTASLDVVMNSIGTGNADRDGHLRGLTWNAALETGGVLVSGKSKLDFGISAIRNA